MAMLSGRRKRRKQREPRPDERRTPPRSAFWTCPRCGRQFVSANKWHSCGQYAIKEHFVDKDPTVRQLFDHLWEILKQFGPVTAYALKTRIVFQAETQFAAALPRKHRLEVYVWLRRRAWHPALRRIEMQVFRDYGHVFSLDRREDLDEALVALLQEAYIVGCQTLTSRR